MGPKNSSSHSKLYGRCACACAFLWDFAHFWTPNRILLNRRVRLSLEGADWEESTTEGGGHEAGHEAGGHEGSRGGWHGFSGSHGTLARGRRGRCSPATKSVRSELMSCCRLGWHISRTGGGVSPISAKTRQKKANEHNENLCSFLCSFEHTPK